MRVQEFLETYPIDSMVPPIKDGLYGAARRQAHIAGEATLSVVQGFPMTTRHETAISYEGIGDIGNAMADRVNEDEVDDTVEFSHFMSAIFGYYMREQYMLGLQPNPTETEFNHAYQNSVIGLIMFGLHYAATEERMKQEGRTLREIAQTKHAGLVHGILNECEVAISLLGLARSKRSAGRNLAILPAPPQVEWYKTAKKTGSNLHADFLLLDTTDPENRKIAPIQVKSLASEYSAQQYDTSKVTLVCGQTDLGNWMQEDGKIYSAPGRIIIQRASEILYNSKNLMRGIKLGYVDDAWALESAAKHRVVMKNIKRKNVNYKEINARLWPRLEKALDN